MKLRRRMALALMLVMLLGSTLTTHAQGDLQETKKSNKEIAYAMLDEFVESVKNNTYVEPRWQNTSKFALAFDVSNNQASVMLDVLGKSGVEEIYATIVLSRLNPQTGLYDHVHTFPYQHAYGRSLYFNQSYGPITMGYTYRATASVIVFKDGQPEQIQGTQTDK